MVLISKKVGFSSGHRYWFPELDAEENKALFGRFASPYNHGHNYVLEVVLKGEITPKTGMVINVNDMKQVIQENIIDQFNDKSINDEIFEFKSSSPSLENLINYFWKILENKFLIKFHGSAVLHGLKLEETPLLYAKMKKGIISITRVYEFAASHRLHSSALSDQENLEIFGKCNHPMGHGHNYILEVTVTGEIDLKTQMLVNIDELDEIVEREIISRYDHRNLNVDIEELTDQNPTSEVVVMAIYNRLKEVLPVELLRVRLYETARNIFEAGEYE